MKKMIAAVAVAATVFAPQAFAQAKNFEGFSVGVNVNFANSTTELTAFSTNKFSASESATNSSIQAQYALALGSNFVLGFGASLGAGDLKSGFVNNTTTTLTKNTNAIYVAPGYAVSETVLVYGKFAALTAKGEITNAAGTLSQDISGVGYGIGLQTMLNKNFFVQAEYAQNNYASKDFTAGILSEEKKSSVVSIGIGYKF